MAPVPLEGSQTPVHSNNMQDGSKGGSISLMMLIDFIVQRTYQELTVLAELLPRKTDMERKIEIYNFASRTRQLFIRLMALVKWANSASKVDKSMHIMAFLDKQAMLFVDTADMLARMARDTVLKARLPNFHIPAAVEVLTTGTYSRIPSCVKDRIIPSDPITSSERKSTLHRLNQVIQHRLVSSNLLPQMRNLKIDNGRVTFHVDSEFKVSLTVMGDQPHMAWHLLHIEILVDDRDIGEGKQLTHPLQVNYIQQVLQARIAYSTDPLKEVYTCLHFFCLSLQLEVYFSQTIKLCRDRLEGHINVDDYNPGKCLCISYWRELTSKDPKSDLGYTLTLLVEPQKLDRPLTIMHVPSLGYLELEIMDEVMETEQLSMEKLLVHTIYIRTRKRLAELKKEISTHVKGIQYTLQGTPAILSLSILQPCLKAEQLLVTVDTHTGMIQCHIPQYSRTIPFLNELQHAFNTDRTNVPTILSELRFWLTKQRCVKTLQHLPVTVSDYLPLLYVQSHSINQIGKRRMFVTFHKHSNYIMIIEMIEKPKSPCEMEYRYYLVNVKRSTIEEGISNEPSVESEIPKLYLKALTKIQLDNFVTTRGPTTSIIDAIPNAFAGRLKRKSSIILESTVAKKPKNPLYFVPEMAHMVAFCDERISFTQLATELSRRGISHQGVQIEANATASSVKVLLLPPPKGISATNAGWIALTKRVLSISIRSISKGNTDQHWAVEFVMYGTPIASSTMHSRDQGMRRPVYFQYKMINHEHMSKVVDALLKDWAQIVHLYCLIEDLMDYIRLGKLNLSAIATVKSYNYTKLVIYYGPLKQAIVTFQWNSASNSFNILFGSMGNNTNAHNLIKEQLEDHLNRNKNLAQILNLLHETYLPLISVDKLPSIPHLNVLTRPQLVVTFAVISQSATVLRIIYQSTYCLELVLQSDGLVSIRDGAYSRFDRSAVVCEYVPTNSLKSFLSKYEDETSVMRRRSQSEDDNPPSPIRADAVDSPGGGFLSGHRAPQSPAQRDPTSTLRFHHPPVTPPSNPHTPASPHAALAQATNQPHQFTSSPATSFSMSSPPSLSIQRSPSTLPHPSPSALLANSPSNPLHVPSPAGLVPSSSPGSIGHSPAPPFLTQGHTEGSPFATSQSMTSPAPSNWPGSPGMPRPSPARAGQSPGGHTLHSPEQHRSGMSQVSRVLPQKPWAGAVPTLLSHEALDSLCSPCAHPQGIPGPELAPLERFLGCVSLRRQIHRTIQSDEAFMIIPNVEHGVLHFKVDGLQCRVCINQIHLQSLHIKISTLPENKDQWSVEDLQILEKFFDFRIAAPPFKLYAISVFFKIITCSYPILKDMIQIMKLDLMPSLVTQQQMKWSLQLCLKIPPSAPAIVPPNTHAFLIFKTRILFFLNVTRVGAHYGSGETTSLVLPVMYDMAQNMTTLAEKRAEGPVGGGAGGGASAPPPLGPIQHASMHMKRCADFLPPTECTIFPVIRDFLLNFTLPSEQSNQMISSTAGPSPMMVNVQQIQAGSPMMHSPMMGGGQQTGPQQPGPSMMSQGQSGPQGYPGMGPPMGSHPPMM